MKTDSGIWVPADVHERKQRGHLSDDDDYEDIEDDDDNYDQHHNGRLHQHHQHRLSHDSGHRSDEHDTDIGPMNEGRQRRTKATSGVALNAGSRDRESLGRNREARGETLPSLVAAHRAVTPAQE